MILKMILNQEKLQKVLASQIHFLAHLNPKERQVIDIYSGGDFEEIQLAVRTGKYPDKEVKEIVDILDDIFERVPPLEHTIIVYRGIKEKFRELPASYLSTSWDLNQANEFMRGKCCLLEITLSAGTKLLPIQSASSSTYEKEILVSRFGHLKLTHQFDFKYHLTYIPELQKEIHPKTTEKEVKNYSDDTWLKRIQTVITDFDVEINDAQELEEIIYSLFPDENVSEVAIHKFLTSVGKYHSPPRKRKSPSRSKMSK